jgi:protein involved in ribonucleotide reduction
MKKIVCDFQMFDINQTIYTVDIETGKIEIVAHVPVEQLVETLATISNNKQIFSLIINGNKSFGNELAKKIIEYSNIHYSENILEIEVK